MSESIITHVHDRSTDDTPLSVLIFTRTWFRDSHNLFDFESTEVEEKEFKITPKLLDTVLGHNGAEVTTYNTNYRLPASTTGLLQLHRENGDVLVEPVPGSSNLLRVLRGDDDGVVLSKRDWFKLGRAKLRVQQIVTVAGSDLQPDLEFHHQETICFVSTDQSGICRICLMDGPGDDEDPLIAPCKCSGSIKRVHLGCLRRWISCRLGLAGKVSGSYRVGSLACEMCKSSYPTTVSIGGSRMPLVQVPPMKGPYIVLEDRARAILHVVPFGERGVIKLGRCGCDVNIPEVSLSRRHATITLEEGQPVLRDTCSRFGTAVGLRRPLRLQEGAPVSLQVGRTILTLSLGHTSCTVAI